MCEFAPLKSLFESALAFGLSGTKSHFIIFKLITTKNKKKKILVSSNLWNKIIQYSLSDSLSSSFFATLGHKKHLFLRGWVCVCECDVALSPACLCACGCARGCQTCKLLLATDEPTSVATSAGATLTAISQRLLRFRCSKLMTQYDDRDVEQ